LPVDGRIRKFRPDFYVPQFNLYIEYFGRAGNVEYDMRSRKKQRAYHENHIRLVSLYPWTLCNRDWPQSLYEQIDTFRVTESRSATDQYQSVASHGLRDWHNHGHRPYRSQPASHAYRHGSRVGYRR